MTYDHKTIEQKWQLRWEKERAHEVMEDPKRKKEKMYILDMFPYPSAQGLHVGHPEGYTATDIVSRYFRMRGKHVLHPMGWDAFGLPAENYAMKAKVHPHESTQKNIQNFRRQIQSLGFSYDWSREIDTSSPEYYRWTQWLFLQLYNKGLAYKKKAPVNWCPLCQTVLANEQVVDPSTGSGQGGACERCHTVVKQKELEQWFFKITDYVERLLHDLDALDWPERIKEMQRNWIGRSEGAVLKFQISNFKFHIEVFTTRADTIFSAAFLVLAPEHPAISNLKSQISNFAEIEAYVKQTERKTERERIAEGKEKTGVELKGIKAINPANGKEIPVWVGDFVLMGYGTGAVFADAHDERDFVFAKKYNIPLTVSIRPDDDALWERVKNLETCFPDDGTLIHSGKFDGLPSAKARKSIVAWLEKEKCAAPKIQYKIRDWLVSRQRYWGAPIPIVYCDACGVVPVPEEDLPVTLPTDVDFRPTGESPLARSESFHNVVCPTCGAKARRESDTMDTFVDSSWYFLRYCDPKNEKVFADKKKIHYWLESGSPRQSSNGGGVDLYVGGAEHAVLHLLYARFITKALHDFGHLDFEEPFLKLRNQGMILGEDGQKMSKSRGNVINPDTVIEEHGADTMRLYEMFMGPFEDAKPWSTDGIKGTRRFIEKVWRLFQEANQEGGQAANTEKLLHKTIKKVTEDIEAFKFNTAISAMMIFMNAVQHDGWTKEQQEAFLKLLAPFAPHVAEELWEQLGHTRSIFQASWPTCDAAMTKEDRITVVIQVNGKARDTVEMDVTMSKEEMERIALAREKVQQWIAGKNVQRLVVISGKLVNIVTTEHGT